MKISFLKEHTGERVDLSNLLLDNSVELNDMTDLDALVERIGESKYVLLGEASHGTHEYYTWRSKISRKLIEEKGFSFIAVEGDWPDCYRLNRYVKNYKDAGESAFDVLHTFNRWPTWMWANWEIVALAEWLKGHNEKQPVNTKVGFYGLDVYSLWESLDMIIKYFEKTDINAKNAAKRALNCFEPYSDGEGQAYARATISVSESCEKEVVGLLTHVLKNMKYYNTDHEAVMCAEQNSHVIVNAERYYRAMVRPGPDSWNIRDHHMMDTLNRLMKFHGDKAKVIVWEHNTHIGDARATDMMRNGTVNVGQLVNEQHKSKGVYSVGFGSNQGTVIAGREWGDVMRVMNVPEAAPNSWEYIMHQLDSENGSEGKNRIVFMTKEMKEKIGSQKFGHRAIGVVYHPAFEYPGNYVPSVMPQRYDAFVYLDKTTALHPLHIMPSGNQMPETYPFGT